MDYGLVAVHRANLLEDREETRSGVTKSWGRLMSGPSDKSPPHVSRPVSSRISSIWYPRVAIGHSYISTVPDEYFQPLLLRSFASY